MRRWLIGTGLALVGVLVVGCTSSSGKLDSGSADHGANAAAGGAAGPAAGPAAVGKTSGGTGGSAQVAKAPLEDGSAKIRIAQMTVDVKRGGVPAAADRAETIALGVGGEVDSDDRTSGRYATASLRLRVPPESLLPVLGQLSRLGHESSRQSSTTDVTERVADVDSRVASARDSIARLRTLYAGATKVSDIIAIEGELNDREADLESLQAQQRALRSQTSLATITLTLRTAVAVAAPKPKHHPSRAGFLGGLERGWHGFVAAARWVATAVGTLLPFLVLLALVGALALLAWRRRPHPPVPPLPHPSE